MAYSVRQELTKSRTVSRSDVNDAPVSPLYDRRGFRKYLTASERAAFLHAAHQALPDVRTFCLALAYTGARVSEALALTPARIDVDARVILIESLKKRRRGHFRAVPIPAEFIAELERVHSVAAGGIGRLWPWSRTTAWERIREVMALAGVTGPQASPKGLRHGFAVASLEAGVPITLVRKWLGHARLEMTERYTELVGEEEQAMARRLWQTFERSRLH